MKILIQGLLLMICMVSGLQHLFAQGKNITGWKLISEQSGRMVQQPESDASFVYETVEKAGVTSTDFLKTFETATTEAASALGEIQSSGRAKKSRSRSGLEIWEREVVVLDAKGVSKSLLFLGYEANGQFRYCKMSWPKSSRTARKWSGTARQDFLATASGSVSNSRAERPARRPGPSRREKLETSSGEIATKEDPRARGRREPRAPRTREKKERPVAAGDRTVERRKPTERGKGDAVTSGASDAWSGTHTSYDAPKKVRASLLSPGFDKISDAEIRTKTYSIVITKSRYELALYEGTEKKATFPAVFGTGTGNKLFEGDKRTPEGTFYVISKSPHIKWAKFILLDFPNQEDRARFEQNKGTGSIPSTSKIGGAIGIHGTWDHEDFVVDQYKNWTDGCISLKNEDVNRLYRFIKPGTQVIIKP